MILGGGFGGGQAGGPPAAGAKLLSIGERDFEAEVFRSTEPVLIYFSSQKTPPQAAQKIDAEVEAVAGDLVGKLKVVKVDIENAPTLVRQLRIQQVPMFMVFAGGKIVDGQAGALGKKALRAMVEPHLPRPEGALKAPEVKELVKRGGVIAVVDTRDASAFGRAHIPGATNLPAEELEGRLAELFMLTGQPVLYCRGGDKTKELVAKLAAEGTEVGYIEGGFLAWEAEGFPIERG